jgi:hypothetical protein
MAADARKLIENGYACIGTSSFNAAEVNSSKALAQARKLQAAIVVVQSKYRNTVSGTIPFTTQDPPQVVTTYNQGSLYGTGGYGNYYGTSTTTIPGGYSTTYIPYSVNRYDYGATFWARIKPPIFGARIKELPDEIRRQIESNRGVLVDIVIKGSPAYRADILNGDVITRINDESVNGPEHLLSFLSSHAGEEVTLEVYRSGQKRLISLRLAERPY